MLEGVARTLKNVQSPSQTYIAAAADASAAGDEVAAAAALASAAAATAGGVELVWQGMRMTTCDMDKDPVTPLRDLVRAAEAPPGSADSLRIRDGALFHVCARVHECIEPTDLLQACVILRAPTPAERARARAAAAPVKAGGRALGKRPAAVLGAAGVDAGGGGAATVSPNKRRSGWLVAGGAQGDMDIEGDGAVAEVGRPGGDVGGGAGGAGVSLSPPVPASGSSSSLLTPTQDEDMGGGGVGHAWEESKEGLLALEVMSQLAHGGGDEENEEEKGGGGGAAAAAAGGTGGGGGKWIFHLQLCLVDHVKVMPIGGAGGAGAGGCHPNQHPILRVHVVGRDAITFFGPHFPACDLSEDADAARVLAEALKTLCAHGAIADMKLMAHHADDGRLHFRVCGTALNYPPTKK